MRESGGCCCLGDQNLVHQILSNLLQMSEAVEADTRCCHSRAGVTGTGGSCGRGAVLGHRHGRWRLLRPSQCPCSVPAELAAAAQAQVLRFAEPFVTCCPAAIPSRPDASPGCSGFAHYLFDCSVSCFNIQLHVVKIRTLFELGLKGEKL